MVRSPGLRARVGFLGLVLFLFCSHACGDARTAGRSVTIRYGHNYPTAAPHHAAAEVFKAEVERRTAGAVVVDIFPAQQMGSMREQLELLQQGGLHIVAQPVSALSNFVPQFQVLDLPYIFPSEDVMWATLDGAYGRKMLALLRAQHVHGLGFVWTGFKQITASRPVRSIDDLAGLKMRVMPSTLLIAIYRGWGATAVGVDFAELYNALQQRVVDGQENGYWTIQLQKYYEVQTHLVQTDHAPLLAVLMANRRWYDALSAAHRQIVADAAREAVLVDRREYRKAEDAARRTVRDSGIQIFVVPETQRARLRQAARPAYDHVAAQFGAEAISELERAVRRGGE